MSHRDAGRGTRDSADPGKSRPAEQPVPEGWVPGARPATPTAGVVENPLVEHLLRLGDDRLVLGHRLSEWCGHGPILEEDIALANIALDLIGQAARLLELAGDVEGKGRNEDALAYFRDAIEFRNVQLVELPNGDFASTIVRQFFFDAWDVPLLERLSGAGHTTLAGIAAKAFKEAKYHLRHSAEWVRMLGDGTAESHERAQRAVDALWGYTPELFAMDHVDRAMLADGNGVDLDVLRPVWRATVEHVLRESTLAMPADGGFIARGGRQGRHTEHLGRMLSEMQSLARAHPGAAW